MKLYEGKVYALASKETEMIYIGSTTQTIDKRFRKHISDRKRRTSCSAIEIMKYPDAYYYEIDRLYVTQPKADPELLKLEGKYQLINKDICVNTLVSRGMTQKEHDEIRKLRPGYKKKHAEESMSFYNSNKESVNHSRKFKRTLFGQLCKLYNI